LPKPTFYNLPHEKQQTLIHSAQEEFSTTSLFDASIANIVKSAGIPRGSFYQYFEDKEDIYFYLLNELLRRKKSDFVRILKGFDGDIFETAIEFYSLSLEEDELQDFKKNVFLNMTNKVESAFAKIISDEEASDRFKELVALINPVNLNFSGEKELYHLLKILTSVTMTNLVEKYAKELSNEDSIENYKIEINLLKRGLFHKWLDSNNHLRDRENQIGI